MSSGAEAGTEGVAPGMFLAEARVEQSTFGWQVGIGVEIMIGGCMWSDCNYRKVSSESGLNGHLRCCICLHRRTGMRHKA